MLARLPQRLRALADLIWTRMLALDGTSPPREVFRAAVPGQFLSIRAIAERVKAGTARAKAEGTYIGRRPLSKRLSKNSSPAGGRRAGVWAVFQSVSSPKAVLKCL